MLVRRLVPSDAPAYQALRLAALRESAWAFSSSYEEECFTPLATIEGHMAPGSGRTRFGAFDGTELVGVVGVGREDRIKTRHKAFLGGMYVAPAHRNKGIARQLLGQALACADAMDGVRQVGLAVTAGNAGALGLYESMGFTVIGREPDALLVDGVFYDDLQMVRRVDAAASLVNRYLAAYNAFDVAGMLAVLSPAVRFENYSGGALTAAASGIDEFRQLAEQATAIFSEREQRITALERSEGGIVATIAYRGVLARGLADGPGAGTVLELQGTSEFSVDDGLIAKIVDRS
jgi:ribosomal protein S18 acetylase RimI-like enzyme